MKLIATALFVFVLAGALPLTAQQVSSGNIRGVVADSTGAVISGANVTVLRTGALAGVTTQTNREGAFSVDNLLPGPYTVQVNAKGFANYENAAVEVTTGKTASLEIALSITVNEQVTVDDTAAIGTEPEANASATVLKKDDIKSLPDDPAELAAALQALAGPGAGPNGGEIFVDGFSGGKMPPRDSIKEVRINQNPFSSEFDRMGLGRIEIITKPGTDKFGGEIQTQFEDESLNSRNPFASNRPPFQLRSFEGNLHGPIKKNKASFFLDAEYQGIDSNSLINARVLDANLNVTPYQQAFTTPNLGIEINPRFDLKLNEKHSLTFRFAYSRDRQTLGGLGGFDLLSRAYNALSAEYSLRFTEAAILAPTIVNEFRFQYVTDHSEQIENSGAPTIRVNDAFTSGGANIGAASNKDGRFEINNGTTFLLGRNTLKIGGRFRRLTVTNVSPSNFAGTFTFTSIDQYRNTILDLPGGTPSQYTVAGGNPKQLVSVIEYGIYAQDDWKLSPSLSLSFGLRYENQTGVADDLNAAPRITFAYAPGAASGKTAKTVIRGGFGFFYERFGRNALLQVERFNGINQQQYVVTNPAILDSIVFTSAGVSNIPSLTALVAFAQPQTTRVIGTNFRIPRYRQTAIGIERQLPYKTTLSLTFVNTGIARQLRSRNINAPIGGVRPNPGAGNIFAFESSGRYNQNLLTLNFRSNFSEKGSIFGNYSFGDARSDTDGLGTFPANSYDLENEYGNSAQDIRHRFTLGGSYTAPHGVRLSPFLTYRSGVPFNITTGLDSNGDTLYTDRPAFATDLNRQCNFGTTANPSIRSCVVQSRFGAFDLMPTVGQTIIPRNFGRGSNYFGVNLSVGKEFGFGGGKDAKDDESPYKIELSTQIRNLFNRINRGTPVGNLSSSFFGQSVSTAGSFGGGGGNSTAGNRSIRLEVVFSF